MPFTVPGSGDLPRVQKDKNSCPQVVYILKDLNTHSFSLLYMKSYIPCLRTNSGDGGRAWDSRAQVLTGRMTNRQHRCLSWGDL